MGSPDAYAQADRRVAESEAQGLETVGWLVRHTAAAYNLWRIPKLMSVSRFESLPFYLGDSVY